MRIFLNTVIIISSISLIINKNYVALLWLINTLWWLNMYYNLYNRLK